MCGNRSCVEIGHVWCGKYRDYFFTVMCDESKISFLFLVMKSFLIVFYIQQQPIVAQYLIQF